MQTPIRLFVAFTLVLRDAAMSPEAKASALHHVQELANSHGSPAFGHRLDDFMARFSEHADLQAELEPLVSALKRLQAQETVPMMDASAGRTHLPANGTSSMGI